MAQRTLIVIALLAVVVPLSEIISAQSSGTERLNSQDLKKVYASLVEARRRSAADAALRGDWQAVERELGAALDAVGVTASTADELNLQLALAAFLQVEIKRKKLEDSPSSDFAALTYDPALERLRKALPGLERNSDTRTLAAVALFHAMLTNRAASLLEDRDEIEKAVDQIQESLNVLQRVYAVVRRANDAGLLAIVLEMSIQSRLKLEQYEAAEVYLVQLQQLLPSLPTAISVDAVTNIEGPYHSGVGTEWPFRLSLSNPPCKVCVLTLAATIYGHLWHLDRVTELLQHALVLTPADAVSERRKMLRALALNLERLGDPVGARGRLEEAMRLPANDPQKADEIRSDLFRLLRKLGQDEDAKQFAPKSPKVAEPYRFEVSDGLGETYFDFGDLLRFSTPAIDEALCRSILQVTKDFSATKGPAGIWFDQSLNCARAAMELGRFEDSERYLNEVRGVALGARSSFTRIRVLSQAGLLSLRMGDAARARTELATAIDLLPSSAGPRLRAELTENLGRVQVALGEYAAAAQSLVAASVLRESVKDALGAAGTHMALGDLYATTHRSALALTEFSKAHDAYERLSHSGGTADALAASARVLVQQERWHEALAVIAKAFSTIEAEKRTVDLVSLSLVEAEAIAATGDADKAVAVLRRAVATAADARAMRIEASARIALSRQLARTSPAQALVEADAALARAARAVSPELQMLALDARATALRRLRRPAEAMLEFERALTLLRDLRTRSGADDLIVGVEAGSRGLYDSAVAVAWELGDYKRAFVLSEDARSRAFSSTLLDEGRDISDAATLALRRISALQREIEAVERLEVNTRSAFGATSSETRELSARRASLESNLEALRIAVGSQRVVGRASQESNTIDVLQATLKRTPSTTVISFFVSSDETFVFIVRGDHFQHHRINIGRAQLTRMVTAIRDFLSPQATNEALKRLGQVLLEPIRAELTGARVIVVPHGALNYIPFAALPFGNSTLGELLEVSQLPSADATLWTKRAVNSKSPTAVVVGGAGLQYVRQEIDAIASSYGVTPFGEPEEAELAFRKALGSATVIHVAAHAELRSDRPFLSRIIFDASADAVHAVRLYELLGLDLSASRLVVLNGCNTQVGPSSSGDDVVALSRVMLSRGAESVIATLWSVDDEAASLLMQRFHEHVRKGAPLAVALRLAQHELWKLDDRYRNPFYWAAFTLSGSFEPLFDLHGAPMSTTASLDTVASTAGPQLQASQALTPAPSQATDSVASGTRTAEGQTRHTAADPVPVVIEATMLKTTAWALPDEPNFGFVQIPRGDALLGADTSDTDALPEEREQHRVTLSAYWMARYEVTVDQFRAFVSDTGLAPRAGSALEGAGDNPVANVTYGEAVKYAQWLEAKLRAMPSNAPAIAALKSGRWRLMLPSEAEWERAARGDDGRRYPWGCCLEADRGNFGPGELAVTRVGAFPAGVSPFGLADMAGNVWEWTRTIWGPDSKTGLFAYPYRNNDGRERADAPANVWRVVRGGSTTSTESNVRSSRRGRFAGHDSAVVLGFRVAIVDAR